MGIVIGIMIAVTLLIGATVTGVVVGRTYGVTQNQQDDLGFTVDPATATVQLPGSDPVPVTGLTTSGDITHGVIKFTTPNITGGIFSMIVTYNGTVSSLAPPGVTADPSNLGLFSPQGVFHDHFHITGTGISPLQQYTLTITMAQ